MIYLYILNNKTNYCKIYLLDDEFSKKCSLEIFKSFITLPLHFNELYNFQDAKLNNVVVYYNESSQIILLKNLVIIFLSDLIKEKNEVESYSSLLKVDLTDKNIIKKYLNEITNNITEISLSHENHFNYFDNPHLYGSKLQLSVEFETIMDNEDLLINKIKFQFSGNSTITIRDKNILEFSDQTKEQDKLLFFYSLAQILN